ncbi:MAG: NAD(P)/FAD-dependent oxidoreductase [Balneolaceae bacterium]
MAESSNPEFDAVIIGSGPNGLSSGILLAQQGLKVKIIEAEDTIGGGTRTKELTEPGFLHDVCSAVHPTGIGSPFFRTLPLKDFGLEWIHPTYPVAHPLEAGDAMIISKSMQETLALMGKDAKNYKSLVQSFVDAWDYLSRDLLAPVRIPNNPITMARFGWFGILSAKLLANSMFDTDKVKAYFAGLAAHSIVPLEKSFTGSFGLVFAATIHSVGWPIAKGGSASISNALAGYFESLSGVIETGNRITRTSELPTSRVTLFDLTPHQIVKIADRELPQGFKNRYLKFKYGPGVFKMDFALSEPVPWINKECSGAGTLHLGGSFEEIAYSERETWKGNHPEKPYVLLSQPSLFDDSRSPAGKHTLWAYCHVPNGSDKDCSEEIINQIERYAPGFRDTIISTHTINAPAFEMYNENYIGGDINGGAQLRLLNN